jgi:hypothetical protein
MKYRTIILLILLVICGMWLLINNGCLYPKGERALMHPKITYENFYKYTKPWEEDWSDVKTPTVDGITRDRITKFIDKLGQIEPAYMAYKLDRIWYGLIDIGEPAVPFLIKGVNSNNLIRACRCLYPLAMLKKLSLQHIVTSYQQCIKMDYATLPPNIEFLLDNLSYLDKTHLKNLIDVYINKNNNDAIVRACIIQKIADSRCGGRTSIPFLIKVLETAPSWFEYVQSRRALTFLTGLFLGDDKEGVDIKKAILKPYFPTDSWASIEIGRFFENNKHRMWTEGEKEARPQIVQKWKNWYETHKHLSTTQWLKDAFDIYTKEIDGTWLNPDDIILKPQNDIRLLYLHCFTNLEPSMEVHELFKTRFEKAKEEGLIPSLPAKSIQKEYEPEDNGSAYREYWGLYGDKIDFMKVKMENHIQRDKSMRAPEYNLLFPWEIWDLHLLCEPKGLVMLIDNLKKLQKNEKYNGVFQSNCKAKKLAGEIFYEVNPVFEALKNLTGQDFGWDWRKTKEEKAKVVEQWEKWVNENVFYLYWSDEANHFVIDEEAKTAGIPTEEYRKTHPWPKEEELDKPNEPNQK